MLLEEDTSVCVPRLRGCHSFTLSSINQGSKPTAHVSQLSATVQAAVSSEYHHSHIFIS